MVQDFTILATESVHAMNYGEHLVIRFLGRSAFDENYICCMQTREYVTRVGIVCEDEKPFRQKENNKINIILAV